MIFLWKCVVGYFTNNVSHLSEKPSFKQRKNGFVWVRLVIRGQIKQKKTHPDNANSDLNLKPNIPGVNISYNVLKPSDINSLRLFECCEKCLKPQVKLFKRCVNHQKTPPSRSSRRKLTTKIWAQIAQWSVPTTSIWLRSLSWCPMCHRLIPILVQIILHPLTPHLQVWNRHHPV